MIDIAARGALPDLDGKQQKDKGLTSNILTADMLRIGITKMENERVARALLNALDLAQALNWLIHGILVLAAWLLTALAATLGAPFWFDKLNKIMVIRSTVKPYEKSKPEAAEDRQNAGQPMAILPVMQPTAVPAPMAQPVPAMGAAPADREAAIDGCDLPRDARTPDEELPPAYGGVQRCRIP